MSGGGGKRKIYLVESTMFSKGRGRLEKWPYLADKCRALRNNNKLGPFLTKTPRCLGFLVFPILCSQLLPILYLSLSLSLFLFLSTITLSAHFSFVDSIHQAYFRTKGTFLVFCSDQIVEQVVIQVHTSHSLIG
jgi:hypothetical protein